MSACVLLVVDGGMWSDPATVGPFESAAAAEQHSRDRYGVAPGEIVDNPEDLVTVVVALDPPVSAAEQAALREWRAAHEDFKRATARLSSAWDHAMHGEGWETYPPSLPSFDEFAAEVAMWEAPQS